MSNKLIEYFSKITALSDKEEKAIVESMVTKNYKKGDFVLKEGQLNKETFFVLNGFVREYKIIEGDEITTNFYTEGEWIISLNSFATNAISKENLICIEDTAVVVGNEVKAQQLFKEFPRLETVSRIVVEKIFSEQQQWVNSYLTDSPKERYLKLLKNRPDIFQKVPQYHIASYIGVKPESLSRIRKRITSKS